MKLLRTEYDHHTKRAYVELRGPDDDGGEAITTVILSYKTTDWLSWKQVEEEIVRKARHLLRQIDGRSVCGHPEIVTQQRLTL